jgi:tRNA threonylcarbamoyladenosine modification (KEOPS) complex  Pcc1 subunit
LRLACSITVEDEPELVERVFEAEDKEFKHGRSGYTLTKKDGKIIINAEAADPTALRATVTSITRILNVINKTK